MDGFRPDAPTHSRSSKALEKSGPPRPKSPLKKKPGIQDLRAAKLTDTPEMPPSDILQVPPKLLIKKISYEVRHYSGFDVFLEYE